MHWELWAIPTGNMIAAPATEAEAQALVRELLSEDWRADELSLILEGEARLAEALPPAVTRAELAARAHAVDPNRRGRQAAEPSPASTDGTSRATAPALPQHWIRSPERRARVE